MSNAGVFNVAVSVVIEYQNKILITKRSPNRGHAPNEWEAGITGRLNKNETFEEAALRETKEELGIEIKLIVPFRTFHFYRGKERLEHQGVNYWARFVAGDIVLNTAEQVEYRWVSPEEALQYVTDPSVIDAVIQFIEFKKHYSP